MSDRYKSNDEWPGILMQTKDGEVQLTNFDAEIIEETTLHDGESKTTILTMSGKLADGSVLPTIKIPATELGSLSWVADQWGTRPIVFPEQSADRHVKTAIQLRSKPKKTNVYTHTGWTTVNGKRTYLSMNGGIDESGHVPELTIQLPKELQNYALPAPKGDAEAFKDSMRFVNMGPKGITWPLLLAAYRSAIGPSDFALHLAGRTGTYKSETVSLIQSHFGQEMTSRHLPASWSSTGNALEALAYKAMHAIIVIDDYVPNGTPYAIKALEKTVDQLIRAQGNQAGRARLSDTTSLQTTYFPRGIILSTGEDVPTGHSVRGRMLILELAPGDILPENLSQAQAVRNSFPQAMADWIHWLAKNDKRAQFKEMSQQSRDANLGVGHTRTPQILGDLVATAHLIMEYAAEMEYLISPQRTRVLKSATDAIIETGEKQEDYLSASDPVTTFKEAISSLLDAKNGHIRTREGGTPTKPDMFGWDVVRQSGSADTYKSNGPRIGWIDWDEELLLIDPSLFLVINKAAGGRIAITQQTLLKRLKEAGMLQKVDDVRSRNTVRVTCEGSGRNVIALSVWAIFDKEDHETALDSNG